MWMVWVLFRITGDGMTIVGNVFSSAMRRKVESAVGTSWGLQDSNDDDYDER